MAGKKTTIDRLLEVSPTPRRRPWPGSAWRAMSSSECVSTCRQRILTCFRSWWAPRSSRSAVPTGQALEPGASSSDGYRERGWELRVGSISLAVPELCQDSHLAGWRLEPGWERGRRWWPLLPRPTWPVFPPDRSRGRSRPWASTPSP